MKYTTEVLHNSFVPETTFQSMKKKNTFNSFESEQHMHRKEHKNFRDMRKNKRNVWQGAE